MTSEIASLSAMEIIDSRGSPTVRVFAELRGGVRSSASVPSGASTGAREAIELRDGDPGRYASKGVSRAVATIANVIAPALIGHDATRQRDIDEILLDLDGTTNKSNLGANAILGVSMAVARAGAKAAGLPLYSYLGGTDVGQLPTPMMNVINGGAHADNSLDFQEFMLVPHGAPSFAEAVRYGVEVFQALKTLLNKAGYTTGVGDEGGFAPNLADNEDACRFIIEAIDAAGLVAGRHVSIAIDPAASAFGLDGRYALFGSGGGGVRTTDEIIDLYADWVERYPIVSIEDGLAENDWSGFKTLTKRLGGRVQIVGDDIYVTNTQFIQRGVDESAANAVLIKPNQIGTITETIEAIDLCRSAGWQFIVSHRSGETEDPFIADFAVAMGSSQVKFGSPCRGERTAKYNRLLEIERELGRAARFARPFAQRVREA